MKEKHVDQFTVRYAGTAVDDHTIDAALLAHALLAFEEINRQAFHAIAPLSSREVKTRLTATRPGSFCFDLDVTTSLIEKVQDLFSPENVSYISDLSAISGITLGSIIAYAIIRLKHTATGTPVVSYEDTEVEKAVRLLTENPQFIANVQTITRPLCDDDVDSMEIHNTHNKPLVNVNGSDAHAIHNLNQDPTSSSYIITEQVRIDTPQLEKPLERKWRFISKEHGVFTALLSDTTFAEQVTQGTVSFARGKVFTAQIRITQQGKKTTYDVLKLTDTGYEQLEF